MRSMLLAKAAELDQFKLQFNCCGTAVEKVRTRCWQYCTGTGFYLTRCLLVLAGSFQLEPST